MYHVQNLLWRSFELFGVGFAATGGLRPFSFLLKALRALLPQREVILKKIRPLFFLMGVSINRWAFTNDDPYAIKAWLYVEGNLISQR